jgi:hypothetical protein
MSSALERFGGDDILAAVEVKKAMLDGINARYGRPADVAHISIVLACIGLIRDAVKYGCDEANTQAVQKEILGLLADEFDSTKDGNERALQ